MRIDTHYEFITQIKQPLLEEETGDYVVSFTGQLVCHIEDIEEDDDFDDEKRFDVQALKNDPVVGTIHGYVIHAGRAQEEGADLLDECDSDSQEAAQLAEAFYRLGTSTYRKEIQNQFSPNRQDLLGIESVMIHPAHRGQGIGLLMVKRLVEIVGGSCGIVAIDVTPAQAWEMEDGPFPFQYHPEKNLEKARKKLVEYFGSLGMEEVAGTPYVAKLLEEGLVPLEAEEAIEELEGVVWN